MKQLDKSKKNVYNSNVKEIADKTYEELKKRNKKFVDIYIETGDYQVAINVAFGIEDELGARLKFQLLSKDPQLFKIIESRVSELLTLNRLKSEAWGIYRRGVLKSAGDRLKALEFIARLSGYMDKTQAGNTINNYTTLNVLIKEAHERSQLTRDTGVTEIMASRSTPVLQ